MSTCERVGQLLDRINRRPVFWSTETIWLNIFFPNWAEMELINSETESAARRRKDTSRPIAHGRLYRRRKQPRTQNARLLSRVFVCSAVTDSAGACACMKANTEICGFRSHNVPSILHHFCPAFRWCRSDLSRFVGLGCWLFALLLFRMNCCFLIRYTIFDVHKRSF